MITTPSDFDGLYRIPAGLQATTLQELLRDQDVALLTSLFDASCLRLFSNPATRPAITLRNAQGGMVMRWRELSVPWIATRANFAIIGMTSTAKKDMITNTSVVNLYALLHRYRQQLRLASGNWYSVANKISDTSTTSTYRVSNPLLLEWIDVNQPVTVLSVPATVQQVSPPDIVVVSPRMDYDTAVIRSTLKLNVYDYQ